MENPLSLFIIGMPRSGTKLLRELLNNHPSIFIPKIETLFLPGLLKKYGTLGKLSFHEIKAIIKELENSLFFFYYLPSNTFDFSKLEVKNITIQRFINLFFGEIAGQQKQNAKILGDKSPNYIYDLNILFKYFPNAQFIHIVRDPRDYALSAKKTWNKNIYRSAHRWALGMDSVAKMKTIMGNNLMEIKYEQLITKPSETLKKICTFLDIDYEKDMQILSKSVENLGDAKTKNISASNIAKYKKALSKKKIKKIESLSINYLTSYGYISEFNILKQTNPSVFMLRFWKAIDGINLLIFNIRVCPKVT